MADTPTYPKQRTLVNVTDYAQKHDLSRTTVYKLLAEGVLTAYRLDDKVLLDEGEAVERQVTYVSTQDPSLTDKSPLAVENETEK